MAAALGNSIEVHFDDITFHYPQQNPERVRFCLSWVFWGLGALLWGVCGFGEWMCVPAPHWLLMHACLFRNQIQGLKHVSFTIKRGTTTAVVGHTGAFARLIEPIPIPTAPRESLH